MSEGGRIDSRRLPATHTCTCTPTQPSSLSPSPSLFLSRTRARLGSKEPKITDGWCRALAGTWVRMTERRREAGRQLVGEVDWYSRDRLGVVSIPPLALVLRRARLVSRPRSRLVSSRLLTSRHFTSRTGAAAVPGPGQGRAGQTELSLGEAGESERWRFPPSPCGAGM